MFNVAVIRLKDLIRYMLIGTAIIAILILGKRYFKNKELENIDIGKKLSVNMSKYIEESINLEMPTVKQVKNNENIDIEKKEKKDNKFKEKFLNTMLSLEFGVLNADENVSTKIGQEKSNSEKQDEKASSGTDEKNEEKKQENKEEEELELAKKEVKTEVTTKNPIKETYTKKYKGVKIRNETSIDLSDDILNPDNLKINKANIIIFHTHTCESYTSSEKYSYTPTGKFRTTDLNYSVARVGDELTKYLKKYDKNVIHNKTYHDYPSYNGSYARSLSTVSKLLKDTKSDIIIDLHRDAIGSNSSYAPTVKIGDDKCAQVMFVIGSNGAGLDHPNWKSNLQFAVKIQEIANKTYPGLFKPIIFRNSRYNQHLGKAACIIEVGSTGNTLEQCLNSMKYLSETINEF